MEKFKCKDCTQVFEGDLSTTKCPNCESENIDLAKKKIPWNLILTALILIGLVFMFRSCPKKILEVNVDQSQEQNCIDLRVNNFKPEYAQKLNVKIERDNSFFTNIALTDEVTQIELPTGCYTFQVTFLDGRKNPKIRQCLDTICFNVAEASPETQAEVKQPPVINEIVQSQNCQTKKWDINIQAKSKDLPLEYSVDGGKNYSPKFAFQLVKGVYTVMVKDSKGLTTSREIVLNEIRCSESITLRMVQSWIDKLANGDADAQNEFNLFFEPNAVVVGMPNANTAYQLMIEILTTQQSVKVKSIDFKSIKNSQRVTKIIVQ